MSDRMMLMIAMVIAAVLPGCGQVENMLGATAVPVTEGVPQDGVGSRAAEVADTGGEDDAGDSEDEDEDGDEDDDEDSEDEDEDEDSEDDDGDD